MPNALTHSLPDKAARELHSLEFFTKLYFCWELTLGSSELSRGNPNSMDCWRNTQKNNLRDFKVAE